MWVVEINVLGHRFTRRVSQRHEAFRLAARKPPWREPRPRQPGAAA